jgi:negative regulator of sigma E activity
VKQDEVESQLSAMFDGELPTAECELLSRRIDRDEKLRGRWSRYALIGAAMRCEPVATAGSDFASRVSRAVDSTVAAQALDMRRRRRNRYVWQSALAASLVSAVAGLSLVMLRQVASHSVLPGMRDAALGAAALAVPAAHGPARLAAVGLRHGMPGPRAAARAHPAASSSAAREPFSYVTPANDASDPTALRTELVDYIVAHSEYSTPLMRPDLLSALISGEDPADDAVHGSGAASPSAADPATHSTATAGDADAPTAASAAGR